MESCSILISGRVQGVSFRAYAKDKADSLNLSGWVKNLPDGSVQALVQGDRKSIENMIDWCKLGSPKAAVSDVVVSWQTPDRTISGFHIRK